MKNDRSGRHLSQVLNNASFKMDNVTNHAVIPHRCVIKRSGMHNGSILNTCASTNHYGAIVTAQYCTWPDGTLGSYGDRANHDGIRMYIGSGVNVGHLVP